MRNKLFYTVQLILIALMFAILSLSIAAHVAKAHGVYLTDVHTTVAKPTPHFEGRGMITGVNKDDNGDYSITIQEVGTDKVYVLVGYTLKVARVAGAQLGITLNFGGDIVTDTPNIAFLTKSHFGY